MKRIYPQCSSSGSCKRSSDLIKSEDETNSTPQAPYFNKDQPYPTSGLKKVLHGNIYQLKLLMLFLHRGCKLGFKFRLGTEVVEAGKFDDIVIQYESNGGYFYRFIQAKHTQDETKTIGKYHLLKQLEGDFSLKKYFSSYVKIKKCFKITYKDKIDFVICTNIAFNFDDLSRTGIEFQRLDSSLDSYLQQDEIAGKTPALYRIAVKGNTDLEFNTFLKNLIFAVNQPNEVELGQIINQELGKEFNFIDSNFIADNFLRIVLDWMKQKVGTYLSNENVSGFFEESMEKVAKLVLVGPTCEYSKYIRESEIDFQDDHECIQKLKTFLHEENKCQFLKYITAQKATKLGSIKVDQVLKSLSQYKMDDSYIFLGIKSLIRLESRTLKAFKSETSNLLIVDSEGGINEEILHQVFKILNEHSNKKFIMIVDNRKYLVGSINLKNKGTNFYQEMTDESQFQNVSESSQRRLLEKHVVFQGESLKLNELINGRDKSETNTIISQNNLIRLINCIDDEPLVIGAAPLRLQNLDSACIHIGQEISRKRLVTNLVKLNTNSENFFMISSTNTKPHFIDTMEKLAKRLKLDSNQEKIIKAAIEDERAIFVCNENTNSKIKIAENFFHLCQKHIKKTIHWVDISKHVIYWERVYDPHFYIPRQLFLLVEKLEKEEPVYLNEKEMLNKIGSKKAVVIVDEPGMGKSTSLISLSEYLRQHNWVIHVQLINYQKPIENLPEKFINIENVLDFLSQVKNTCLEDTLTHNLLKHSLQLESKTNRLPLIMFDGFDEIIQTDCKEKIILLIRFLINKTRAKIWITTRESGREIIKREKFSDLAFVKFKPFEKGTKTQEGEQEKYLKHFWQVRLSLRVDLDTIHVDGFRRFDEYVKKLLDRAAPVLIETAPFMGTPLQLRLMAEGFLEDLRLYLESTCTCDDTDILSSFDIINLYKLFISARFSVYFKEKVPNDRPFQKKAIIRVVNEYHTHAAFSLLFSEKMADEIVGRKEELTLDEVYDLKSFGVIQSTGSNINTYFIHRTFAEYYVADFIIKNFDKEGVPQLVLNKILLNAGYVVIRTFLNAYFARPYSVSDSPEMAEKYGTALRKLLQSDSRLRNNDGESIFHLISKEGMTEIINFLLKCMIGFETILQELINIDDSSNKTALFQAASKGHLDSVKLLVSKGANVNFQAESDEGYTALHGAASYKRFEVVKWLVESGGADVKIRNDDDETVINLLASWFLDSWELIKWLIQRLIDSESEEVVVDLVNQPDVSGQTILYLAASHKNWNFVKWLIQVAKANPNAHGMYAGLEGHTVLHEAVDSGDFSMVRWLVTIGNASIDNSLNAFEIETVRRFCPDLQPYMDDSSPDSTLKNFFDF